MGSVSYQATGLRGKFDYQDPTPDFDRGFQGSVEHVSGGSGGSRQHSHVDL